MIGSKRRFYRAGEPIPDSVSVPGCAEKYRTREEQPDESDPPSTVVDNDEATERARVRDREDPEWIEDGLTSAEDIAHEMGITVSKWAKRAIQDGSAVLEEIQTGEDRFGCL